MRRVQWGAWAGLAALVVGTGCGKAPETKVARQPAPAVAEAPTALVPSTTASPFTPVTFDEAPLDKRGEGRLPDGTFTGALRGEGVSGEVELTVVAGVLIGARARVAGEPELDVALEAVRLPDDPELALMGRSGDTRVSVNGRFVEGERAAGTFDVTVGRRGLTGRWFAIRR